MGHHAEELFATKAIGRFEVRRPFCYCKAVLYVRRVYVLVDARRGINSKDTDMIEMLTEHSIPCQVRIC